MKAFSDTVLQTLERGDGITSAAAAIYGSPPLYVWGGHGPTALAGDTGAETYKGVGNSSLGGLAGGQIGGSAQNVTLTLSGIDPEALALLDATEVKGASSVIRRLIFDNSGRTLLGAYVFTRGRLDQLTSSETIGGPAALQATIETAARGLGRRGGRTRSDADQRLINPTDGFFKNVSFVANKTLYWGGKRPSIAGQVVNGGGTSSAGGIMPDAFGGPSAGGALS